MGLRCEERRSEVEEADFAFISYLVSDTSFSHILINKKELVNQHPIEGFKVLHSNMLSFTHLTFFFQSLRNVHEILLSIKCYLLSKKEIGRKT